MKNTMKQPKEKITVEVRYTPKQELSAGLSRLYDLLLAVPAVDKDAVTMPADGSDQQHERTPVKPEKN
jgi:hypothetical protein